MGRARLAMELIGSEKSRNTTFHKRSKGLKKKMYEFSTLCGVDACMIIYGPYQNNRPMYLDTWPSNPHEVRRIIDKYKSKVVEGGNRSIDLSEYFEFRRKKTEEEIVRLRRQNAEALHTTWDDRIGYFSLDQLGELLVSLDSKLEVVKTWIELVKESRRQRLMIEEVASGMTDCSYTQAGPQQSNFYYDSTHQEYLFQRQLGYSFVKPLDINHAPIDQCYSSNIQGPDQMISFDQNPNPNFDRNTKTSQMRTMMVMNDSDYSQIGGASSSNNPILQAPLCYNPMTGMLETTMHNNPKMSPSYHSPSMQLPMQPNGQPSVMSHASHMLYGPQANNYYDFNEFKVVNNKGMHNNHRMSPSYPSPSMQLPMQPNGQPSVKPHASHMLYGPKANNYYDFSEFEVVDNKGRY